MWSREEGILLPARQWLWGNVPTIVVPEKQILLQMSPQIVNAYIFLSVVLFHVLGKAGWRPPRSSSHKGLEEGRKGCFLGSFFFFSLYSILAPFCEMKTQIHKATPPTTVKEEGMDWRSIKSGLRLSRREISFYLPATAEFSPNFFLPLLDFVLLSQDWAELQCFYHSPEAIFPHCLIIPHTSDFTQCSCIP